MYCTDWNLAKHKRAQCGSVLRLPHTPPNCTQDKISGQHSNFNLRHFRIAPSGQRRRQSIALLNRIDRPSSSTVPLVRRRNHTMGSTSLADLIAVLPDGDGWGPQTTAETTLNGVPYAPFSKGDKLGRMADWTADGKDGRDGRGGRQQYNRNYRGRRQLHDVLAVDADLTWSCRPADLWCGQCRALHSSRRRSRRKHLLCCQQRAHQDEIRTRRRLHPWPWPERR